MTLNIRLKWAKLKSKPLLSHLAVEGNVSASTQNQALFALLFLYKEVLQTDLPQLGEFTTAKKSNHVPVVLTKEEVKLIFKHLTGTNWLIANLLYGAGLRLKVNGRLKVSLAFAESSTLNNRA